MKCHAGVEFTSGKPCPKCGAKLGEVCWPGINADLLEVVSLRIEITALRSSADDLAKALEKIADGGKVEMGRFEAYEIARAALAAYRSSGK
jgi:hypothetical protein